MCTGEKGVNLDLRKLVHVLLQNSIKKIQLNQHDFDIIKSNIVS